jgi:hypothetical protein
MRWLHMRSQRSLFALAAAGLGLVGCALQPPSPGSTRDEVLQRWGEPTAIYALPEGRSRLEYATGPYGRTTWMVDIASNGNILRSRQVLNEAEFLAVQTAAGKSADGLSREELLRWLGTPGERRHGGRPGGQVWSWRYPTNDCLWFEFSVSDAGRATAGAYSIDPRCDAPADGRS